MLVPVCSCLCLYTKKHIHIIAIKKVSQSFFLSSFFFIKKRYLFRPQAISSFLFDLLMWVGTFPEQLYLLSNSVDAGNTLTLLSPSKVPTKISIPTLVQPCQTLCCPLENINDLPKDRLPGVRIAPRATSKQL